LKLTAYKVLVIELAAVHKCEERHFQKLTWPFWALWWLRAGFYIQSRMFRWCDSETLLGAKQDEHGKCEQNLLAWKLHCVLTSYQLVQVWRYLPIFVWMLILDC